MELLEPAIPDGTPVITEGQFLINDGTAVAVHATAGDAPQGAE
jgi:hypothetical protein